MSESPVRGGVVGVGALGRHHARVWAGLEGAELVGVHDSDPARAEAVAKEFDCPVFPDLDSLLGGGPGGLGGGAHGRPPRGGPAGPREGT